MCAHVHTLRVHIVCVYMHIACACTRYSAHSENMCTRNVCAHAMCVHTQCVCTRHACGHALFVHKECEHTYIVRLAILAALEMYLHKKKVMFKVSLISNIMVLIDIWFMWSEWRWQDNYI